MNACLKLCSTTCQAFRVRGRSSVPSSMSCSHSDCILVHPFVLFPFIKERKYVTFFMGFLAILASRLSDMNWQNLIRKSFVSFLSPSNFSGGFPSSRPHFGWSVVVLPQLGWLRADFESCGFFRIQLNWPQAANQKPWLWLSHDLQSTWVDLSMIFTFFFWIWIEYTSTKIFQLRAARCYRSNYGWKWPCGSHDQNQQVRPPPSPRCHPGPQGVPMFLCSSTAPQIPLGIITMHRQLFDPRTLCPSPQPKRENQYQSRPVTPIVPQALQPLWAHLRCASF